MKKLVALLLAMTLMFSLALCGGAMTTAFADDAETVLRISCLPGNSSVQMRTLGEAFHEKHPEVSVEIIEFEEATYKAQGARILTAPENELDVAWYYRTSSWEEMIKNGVYEPLNDIYEKENMVEGYGKELTDNFQIDGQYYAVPFVGIWLTNIYYNPVLMEEHGWEIPTTWAELYELAGKIKAEGLIPMAAPAKDTYGEHPVCMMAVREFDDASHAIISTPGQQEIKFTDERWMEIWNELINLQENVFQEGVAATDSTTARSLFLQGQAVMYCDLSGSVTRLMQEAPEDFKFGYFMLPNFKEDVQARVPMFIGNIAVVLSGSKNKEVAKEFVAFCGSQEGQSLIALKNVGVPARADVTEEARATLGEVYSEMYKDMAECGTTMMFTMFLDSEFIGHVNEASQGVLSGSMTPEEAGEFLQESFDSIYED